jgi:putative heme transporter
MAGGIAVVVATFVFVLPKIADYRDVWDAVKELSWKQVVALGLATLLNLATYAPPWQAALPGLHFRQAFVVTQASTASTYIAPGGAAVGMALSYGMLRGWGFPGAAVGLAVAVTGVWNQFVLLGFPVIALALLTTENETHPLLETVSVIGLIVLVAVGVLFALGLSTARIARGAGNLSARVVNKVLALIRRKEVHWGGESFVRFRADTVGLLRRRWHVLTLATLAGHLSVFLLFVVCLRALGVTDGQVTVVEAFAAWSLVRLLGSIPLTPGGIGIVEVGLTTALIGFGGANAEVVAAVLVYRFLTLVPTLVLGLVLGATWRRHQPQPQPQPQP